MKKKNTVKTHKNIILDASRLIELNAIFEKHGFVALYSATTKDKSEVRFDSLEELLSFDNFKGKRIVRLTISCYDKSSYSYPITVYIPSYTDKATVEITYEFSSLDEESVFISDINSFFDKATEHNLASLIFEIILFIIFIVLAFYGSYLILKSGFTSDTTFSLIISSFLSLIICYLTSKYVLEYFLPRTEFLIGEEVSRYERIKKTRSNIFWVIIVGVLVTVFYNLFLAKLF